MIAINKQVLETIAREQGFIRDNMEKVLRLVSILDYINHHELLQHTLTLKGGTAINLAIFRMPRLSVDIDLDFAIPCDREEMLEYRNQINNASCAIWSKKDICYCRPQRTRTHWTHGFSPISMQAGTKM